ncbi:ParB N-terminal domain-containing protein [Mammaliicoccus sciuri]|uniref:ParB N-terminal domain-containing protein n=1 Tax=Mammaliicoccus sciuri TaxID=1296 RepID=UPI002DB603AF|nr:ParB N-terminal domain-containing protein [Mammaliicoccus sciuri]MEB5757442.1 ParB N-terminal domain-containing protein [Mammaliicoccus sciuri]
MLVNIDQVKVGKRIRKDYGDIISLADDISDRGLINPPVVTPDYELIAGERRLKALQRLDYKQIEVRVMAVEDYEHQLKIEISENEERKEFTYSERMDYAQQLERIEAKKSKDRQLAGKDLVDQGPQGKKGKTRDIVGEASGFGSGRTYARAKYIYENGDEEMIKEVDEGKKSIRKAHDELREKNKQKEVSKAEDTVKDVEKPKSKKRDRREEINARYDAVSPEDRHITTCETNAINIVSMSDNLLYQLEEIEDLDLTLQFLKSQNKEDIAKVIKVTKALQKIIEKGDFQNV